MTFSRPRSIALSLLLAGTTSFALQSAPQQAATPANLADFFSTHQVHVFDFQIPAAEWDKMQKGVNAMPNFAAMMAGARGRGGQPPAGQPGPPPGQAGPPQGFPGLPPGGAPPGPGGRGPGGGRGMMPTSFADPDPGVADLTINGQHWGKLNVRYKGNSSLMVAANSLKKSLKLDFDDLDGNAQYLGLKKLNLNNNAMDSSALRESLAYDVFRAAGVPAPRTAYARVYFTVPGLHDRQYAGLYTVVEQIDQTFFRDRFGAKTPMLLKPERQGGQPYLGESWDAYVAAYGDKSETRTADGQKLIAFTKLLNEASDDEFGRRIGDHLDVEAFVRFLAVQAVVVNLDSPMGSGGNYYLATHPKTGKLVFLPWDLNEAFGGFMSGATADATSVMEPSAPGVFRLAERMLAIESFRTQYRAMVRTIATTNFTTARLGREIATRSALVRSAINGDPLIATAAFEDNMRARPAGAAISPAPPPPAPGGPGPRRGGFGGFGGGAKPLLLDFVTKRAASVVAQLDGKAQGVRPAGMGFGFGPGRGAAPPPQ